MSFCNHTGNNVRVTPVPRPRRAADKADGKDSTGFNIGGIYDFTDHYHLVFSAGRGIQHAKETNEFSWYIGFEVTGGDDKP
jgi:hypothetical protein